jgi:hypothetical protein
VKGARGLLGGFVVRETPGEDQPPPAATTFRSSRRTSLRSWRIQGQDRPGQVQPADERREFGNLICLRGAVDAEYSLSDVASKLGLPLTTVQREVTRLSGAQLIRERRVGRPGLVSADPASRHTRPLAELVTLAFGPYPVIREVRPRDLYEAAGRAGRRLGLPVNPTLYSRPRWFATADPLIRQIRSAPLV